MPNWCENCLTVHGREWDVTDFRIALRETPVVRGRQRRPLRIRRHQVAECFERVACAGSSVGEVAICSMSSIRRRNESENLLGHDG
jgi:hypothetical protein